MFIPGVVAASGASASAPGYDIVLLLGQSNMQGWTSDEPGVEDTTDARIEQYRMDAGNVGTIALASEPLKWPEAPTPANSVGPGLAFARALLPSVPSSRKILLIPGAVGATGLVAPGNSRWGVGDDLFEAAMDAAVAAMTLTGSNRIAAVLWSQGEHDALGGVSQSAYRTALLAVVDEIRDRLGDVGIPFLCDGAVPEWEAETAAYAPIKAALESLPLYRDYTHFADGLPDHDDPAGNIHYGAAGNRLRGARFATDLPTARSHQAPDLDPDALSIIAAMSDAPDEARRNAINTLVEALKAAGTWPKRDLIRVYAAHDEQASRVDWKDPTQVGTTTGTLTFTVDRGQQSDGSTGRIDTGFNPSTDAVAMANNSVSYGTWQLSGIANNDAFGGGCYDGGTTGVCMRECQVNGDILTNACCDVTAFAAGETDSTGFTVQDQAAGTLRLFKDGAQILSPVAVTPGVLPDLNIWTCGLNSQGSLFGATTAIIAIQVAGGSLTPSEHAAEYAAFAAYMTAIGAI